MAPQTYFKVLQAAKQKLTAAGKYFEDLMYIFLTRKHWTQTDYLTHQQAVMPIDEQAQLKKDVAALLANQPPQYLVHQAWFYGRPFYVDERVLIPQYDTETLVQWVLQDFDTTKPLRVLDIGTGSGILALSLKLAHPQWLVTATDISQDALNVAQQNAKQYDVSVTFLQGDLFAPVLGQTFDLIVANPPYIAVTEQGAMDDSVRLHEPEIALFAKEAGLAFYRRFAQSAAPYLSAQARFYLEFGYQQKAALSQLFATEMPQASLTFQKDLAGQDRILCGRLNLESR